MANASAGAPPPGKFGTFVTVLTVIVVPPNSVAGTNITVLARAPVVGAINVLTVVEIVATATGVKTGTGVGV